MQREANQQPEQSHLLDQIILPALPPEFQRADIARQYGDGEFASRLDAEIEDILRGCQRTEETGEEAPILLSSEALAALRTLNCVALIQDGQVLPLLDIEQSGTPMTVLQRTQLYHAAARTLLDAIAAIYEDQAERTRRKREDENGGEHSFA